MIYVDTSSLLKLIFIERFSDEVLQQIEIESLVVASGVTRLEADVQLRARRLGGLYGDAGLKKAQVRLAALLSQPPFELADVSAGLFQIALRQHNESEVHCRSLGRLHLAAMEELGVRRLMTHDLRQAEAAREMGIEVVMPGLN